MSAEWQIVKLKDIADLKGGNAFKSGEYSTEGVFVLRTVNINEDGSITEDGAKYVSDETAAQYKRFYLQEWDTLFVMVGATLGKTGLVREYDLPALLNQNMWVVRAKSAQINPRYLHYAFSEESKALLGFASGAARDFVRRDDFRKMELRIPPKETQDKISTFVGAIDDKVRLNHQINQTLEQMAQAIFKSWFVDFEPVKAKIAALEAGGSEEDALFTAMQAISGSSLFDADASAAGAKAQLTRLQAEQPEQYAELRATAELFPSDMQDSELGEIPEGWRISQIGDEVTVVGGGTPSTKNPDFWENGEINWTSPKDLSNLSDKVLVETERKVTEAGLAKISSGLLPVDTVLMSSRAPVGYLSLAKIPVAVNQGYIAMKCEEALSPEFVIQWCAAHMDEIKSRASGTTFAEISKKNFKIIPVVMPPESLISTYSRQVSTIYKTIENNVRESDALAKLRDFLLPKLLSGELSVTSAEGLSAEVMGIANV